MLSSVSRFPSSRLRAVQDPIIPIVGDLIRSHPGTISLGQGMVHYSPPPDVAEAVGAAVSRGVLSHQYGPVEGDADLLEAIGRKLADENGIAVGPDRAVAVTAGANMAFLQAVPAIADPGDEIVLLSPFYFNHEMAVRIAGCVPVVVPTTPDYQPDLDRIASAWTRRTRAVVTISPNNPTGAVYRADDLRAINLLCAERGAYHIHDHAYEYFHYGEAPGVYPASFPGAEGHTLSIYSLSKAYGMAGWRLGYIVSPAPLREAFQKIQDTNLICPPRITQVAGLAALGVGSSWCTRHLPGLAEVRSLVLDAMSRLGDRVEIPTPEGAFYVFVRLHTRKSDLAVVRELVQRYGVAVIPGCTFGVDPVCSVRIAYGALQRQSVAEAMERLVSGLADIL